MDGNKKSYYPMAEDEGSEMTEGEDAQKPDAKEDDGTETSLLPKSMLGDYQCKPGDKIICQVVAEHEGEIEVRFVGKDKEGGEPETEPGLQDRMMASMNRQR